MARVDLGLVAKVEIGQSEVCYLPRGRKELGGLQVPWLMIAPGLPIIMRSMGVLARDVSVQVYNSLLLRYNYNKGLIDFLRLCSKKEKGKTLFVNLK